MVYNQLIILQDKDGKNAQLVAKNLVIIKPTDEVLSDQLSNVLLDVNVPLLSYLLITSQCISFVQICVLVSIIR